MLSSVQSFRFCLGNDETIWVVWSSNEWGHRVIGWIVYGCQTHYLSDDSRVRVICCGYESRGRLVTTCDFLKNFNWEHFGYFPLKYLKTPRPYNTFWSFIPYFTRLNILFTLSKLSQAKLARVSPKWSSKGLKINFSSWIFIIRECNSFLIVSLIKEQV